MLSDPFSLVLWLYDYICQICNVSFIPKNTSASDGVSIIPTRNNKIGVFQT